MTDETTQTIPEPTQPEPISTPSIENPISEPNPVPASPAEPTAEASIPPYRIRACYRAIRGPAGVPKPRKCRSGQ